MHLVLDIPEALSSCARLYVKKVVMTKMSAWLSKFADDHLDFHMPTSTQGHAVWNRGQME